ncbi:hypothetical protein GF374_01455, partial [Candidatus Woesearchaeota archaeon]|nr:hypothetical protein [Candidatus Woesearchaeota archaeon]
MDKIIYLREIGRQLIHLIGVSIAFPILFLDFNTALKVLAGLILFTLFASWYYEKRRMREKYFKSLINDMDLPEPNKKQLLANANRFAKYETKLLHSFIEQFKRRKEKQPLFATFAFILSGTICFILFGKIIAILAIITLAFGDSASAIIGKKFGKHKLLWNKELSVEGSIAFFASASIAVYLFLAWQPQFAIMSTIFIAIISA